VELGLATGGGQVGKGYSAVGLSCNYAYACNLMGRFENPGTPGQGGIPLAGLSNADGVYTSTSGIGKQPASTIAACGPKTITSLLGYCRSAGVGSTNAIVVMDGCWWVCNNSANNGNSAYSQSYYGDSVYNVARYLHVNQTANALFVDTHVESGAIGTLMTQANGVVPPDFKNTSTSGVLILYK
jgi:prepilin-type processing-associated H-X9-DG protein